MGLNDEVYRLRREAMTNKQLKRVEREENRKRREELRKDADYKRFSKEIIETELFDYMYSYYEKNGYFSSNYYFKIYSTRKNLISFFCENEGQRRFFVQNYDKIFKKVDNIFKNSIILPEESQAPPEDFQPIKANLWKELKEAFSIFFGGLFKFLAIIFIGYAGIAKFLCSLGGGSKKRYR